MEIEKGEKNPETRNPKPSPKPSFLGPTRDPLFPSHPAGPLLPLPSQPSFCPRAGPAPSPARPTHLPLALSPRRPRPSSPHRQRGPTRQGHLLPRAELPCSALAVFPRCPWPHSARARARGPLAGLPEPLLLLEASPLEPDQAKPLGRSAFPAEQHPAAITAASPPGTPSQDPRGSLISIPRPPAPPIPQPRSREARAAHPRRAAPLLRHTEPLRRRRLATSVPPSPGPGPQQLRPCPGTSPSTQSLPRPPVRAGFSPSLPLQVTRPPP